MTKKKNINNNFGYKVPEGYFDSLEDSLFDKIKSESLSEKSGFKIPEDYFTNIEIETPSEVKSGKVIQLHEWSKWIAAASIVAFVILGALYIDNISPKQSIQFSDLDDDMIERYLDHHLETPDEFIDYEKTSIEDIINEDITKLEDHDIIEYLNDKLQDQDFENE